MSSSSGSRRLGATSVVTLSLTSALLLAGPAGARAGAAPTSTAGTLYATDVNNARIDAVAPDGTRTTVAAHLPDTPYGVAADAHGNVWVADGRSGLLEVTPDGTVTDVPVQGLQSAWQVAVDHSGDVYVVESYFTNKLFKVSPDGTSAQVDLGGFLPQAVAVDSADHVYLTGAQSGTAIEVAPDGTRKTLASDLLFPQGIAVADDGTVWIADTENNRLVRVGPDGAESSVASRDLQYPQWLGVDRSGAVYATSGNSGSGGVYQIREDGSADLVIPASFGVSYSFGIAVSPAAQLAQVPDFTSSPPASPTVGDRYDVSAHGGGSGNPVTFAADGASQGVCLVRSHHDDTATVTLTGAGTCTVDAAQAGDRGFLAGSAKQAFVVRATGALTFTSEPGRVRVGDTYQAVAAGDSPAEVTYTSSTPAACTVSGTGSVTFLHARPCTVTATQAATERYLGGRVDQVVAPLRARQHVVFTSKAPRHATSGSKYHVRATGNAGSGRRVTISAVGACSVSSHGVVHFTRRGSCVLTAREDGTADFAPGRARQAIAVRRR